MACMKHRYFEQVCVFCVDVLLRDDELVVPFVFEGHLRSHLVLGFPALFFESVLLFHGFVFELGLELFDGALVVVHLLDVAVDVFAVDEHHVCEFSLDALAARVVDFGGPVGAFFDFFLDGLVDLADDLVDVQQAVLACREEVPAVDV